MKKNVFFGWFFRRFNQSKSLFSKKEKLNVILPKQPEIRVPGAKKVAEMSSEIEGAYSPTVLAKWLSLKDVKAVQLWDVFDPQTRGYLTTIWAVTLQKSVWWMQVGGNTVYRSCLEDLDVKPAISFRLKLKDQDPFEIVAVCQQKKERLVVTNLLKVRKQSMFEETNLKLVILPCPFERLVYYFS